ncbi:MAG: hypothetical protein J6E46_05200 [Faecalicoccus sp.]|nr:hypothetical protein [Faecalicoccus sp.]
MKRYEVLRKLQPIYSDDAPVFLLDGQILKDKFNDGCLLQLKLQNVGDKIIKSISLNVKAYDAKGNLLDTGEYNYLDLHSKRDDNCGKNQAIELRNNQTRNVDLKIQKIIFDDDSVLDVSDVKWYPLPQKDAITNVLSESRLLLQYHLDHGYRTNYIAKEFGNYWYCTCGGINHSYEQKCHLCEKELHKLKQSYPLRTGFDQIFKVGDLTELKENFSSAGMTTLKEHADKRERDKQNRQKARRRALQWAGSFAAVCLCLFLFVTQLVLPYKQYRETLAKITAGNYEEAYTELRELGSFFDSEKYLSNFHALPVHIEDNTNAISMDMTYDQQGRLIEENAVFTVDYEPINYKTVYTYEGYTLKSSVTETDKKIFNATYSNDGKTVTCESYLKEKIHEDGTVDDADKEMYTYTLEFDSHYNVVSMKLEGDYEQEISYNYEYDENDRLDVIRSEDESDAYQYYYKDGMIDSIYEKSDSYTINFENKLFYSTKLEPYVGWWYRNPWILFVEYRV